MVCSYCKSELLFLKTDGDKTGLYCRSCGRWIKWVDPSEKIKIEEQIEKQKREIRVDGKNVEIVLGKYKDYKKKFGELNDEIRFYNSSNTLAKTPAMKKKMYEQALKLKDITAKIAAYDEILSTLQLRWENLR